MGKISVKRMTTSDFSHMIKLTDTMHWDLTEKDFRFMMDLEPEGCLVAWDRTERVGIATTLHFGSVGWIGNVIVDNSYRSKGVGSLLMKQAMNYLMSKSVRTIGLYSYLDTISFYERFGFKRDSSFIRMVGHGSNGHLEVKPVQRMRQSDMQDVINLDKTCFGGSRERLLRRIFKDSKNLCYVMREGKQLVGFIMADWYRQEIGPWVCRPNYEGDVSGLLKAALGEMSSLEVRIGVSEKRHDVVDALKGMNFREEFKVVTMYYGYALKDAGCLLAMESLERG